MAISRSETMVLGAAAALALAMPAWLLSPRPASPGGGGVAAAPMLVIPIPPPLSAAFARPVFSTTTTTDDAPLPADAPRLIGIAGRIGSDAVALVRGDDGSRTLRVGEGVDGWTLESLAIDAAFFTRGTQRLRVPLPAG